MRTGATGTADTDTVETGTANKWLDTQKPRHSVPRLLPFSEGMTGIEPA